MSKQKSLTTYLNEEDELYQAVRAEVKQSGLSQADILRLALRERYERKLTTWREMHTLTSDE